jgi:hypothetical protein
MNAAQAMEFINRPGSYGILATVGPGGESNAALFASARMPDEQTLVLGLSENRSLNYLRDNPHACFLAFEPGDNPLLWRGVRLYLRLEEISDSGPLFETLVAGVKEQAGETAAGAIRAAVRFAVTTVRPLIDLPQRRRRRGVKETSTEP